MKTAFLICTGLISTLLLATTVYSVIKKSKYSKDVLHSHILGILTIIFYTLTLCIKQTAAAILIYSIYFSCIDWTLFTLMLFCCHITETEIPKGIKENLTSLFIILCIVDTISLLVNIFSYHCFNIEQVLKNGRFYCWSASFRIPYYIHLGFCYIMVVISIVTLMTKILGANKKFRIKYEYIILTIVVVITINAVFLISGSSLDWSIIAYGTISISLSYFCFIAMPGETKEQSYLSIADNINSVILCFDLDDNLVYENHLAEQIFADKENTFNSAEDYLKNNLTITEADQHPEDYVDHPVTWDNEPFTIKGEIRYFCGEYSLLHDSKGKTTGKYIKLDDNTEAVNKLKQSQHRSRHDLLTDLYNRAAFFQKVEATLHQYPDDGWYLVGTDIENFKLINEQFGTDTGNAILKEQAELLKKAAYKDCIKGRISDDRFAMLIRKKDFNAQLAVKNTSVLQKMINNTTYRLHTYLGVYEIADIHEKAAVMFDKTMLAVNSIKGSYEHILAWYDRELMDKLNEETRIVAEFAPGLKAGQFQMYLQPQMRIDGKIMGAEALSRWNHPEKGLLQPGQYLPVLEKKGLISLLDEYMWEQAAAKLAEWKRQGIDYYISVNISTQDFYYKDLYKLFIDLVDKYDISPSKLKLEITETILIHDKNLHRKLLAKLQAYGFIIEMDDFGSGYSSLNTLTKFNMDVLKIDMGFLEGSENSEKSHTILASIISMAEQLHMEVICEGVETITQADCLSLWGCHLFQGYYFSKPLSISDFNSRYVEAAK